MNAVTSGAPPRSWLYVPAHDERKVAKSVTTGADAVIFDLEDGTPLALKDRGREVVAAALAVGDTEGSLSWVRINALEGDDRWRGDLEVAAPGAAGIVVPKVSVASQLVRVREELTRLGSSAPIAAIVTETVGAALDMGETLQADAGVAFAFWGTEDLQSDLGATRIRDESANLLGAYAVVEGMFLLESRRAGVRPVDTPTLALDDLELVERESVRAAAFGFVGRQVIHPRHVPIVNEAFRPSPAEVERAQSIVVAFGEDAAGAYRVDDGMVDAPHLRSARRVIHRAEMYGVKSS